MSSDWFLLLCGRVEVKPTAPAAEANGAARSDVVVEARMASSTPKVHPCCQEPGALPGICTRQGSTTQSASASTPQQTAQLPLPCLQICSCAVVWTMSPESMLPADLRSAHAGTRTMCTRATVCIQSDDTDASNNTMRLLWEPHTLMFRTGSVR